MALDTIDKRLANVADYFNRNLYANHNGLIRNGSDRTVGIVLVETLADVSAYSAGKGVAHTDENVLSTRSGPIVIDSKYLNKLCRDGASAIQNLSKVVDPLRSQVAELDALAKARQATITTLEANVMSLTTERDNAITSGNTREANAIAAGQARADELTALLAAEKAKTQNLEQGLALAQTQIQEQLVRISQLMADLNACQKNNPTATASASAPAPAPASAPALASEPTPTDNSLSASIISTTETIANTSGTDPTATT